jgi:hypothetical protein
MCALLGELRRRHKLTHDFKCVKLERLVRRARKWDKKRTGASAALLSNQNGLFTPSVLICLTAFAPAGRNIGSFPESARAMMEEKNLGHRVLAAVRILAIAILIATVLLMLDWVQVRPAF